MVCKLFVHKIDDYLDGALDKAAADEMEAHEAKCQRCAAHAAQARALRGVLAQMGEETPPANLHARMMDAVQEEAKAHGKPKRKTPLWAKISGIAAAAVVVVALVPLSATLLFAGRNAYSMPYPNTGGYGESGTAKQYTAMIEKAAAEDMVWMDESMEKPAYDGGMYDDMAAFPADSPQAVPGGMGSLPLPQPTSAPSGGAKHGLKLIRSGYVTLESRQFDEDLATLNTFIAQYDGYIESSSISGIPYNADPRSYGRWANFSVRIPSASLDAFLSSAKSVGNTLDSSLDAYDITSSYHDTELRLTTLKTQHKRLNELLAKAERVEDLIALESELSRVQYEMDNLAGTLQDWDNRVDYSSIHINVSEVHAYALSDSVDPTLGERISDGFRKGLFSFVEGLQDILVFIVTAFPILLLVIGTTTGAFFLIRHLVRRRKKARRADDAPPKFAE